jgi:hypothetical protein
MIEEIVLSLFAKSYAYYQPISIPEKEFAYLSKHCDLNRIEKVIVVGGGAVPYTALFFAQKIDKPVYAIEKNVLAYLACLRLLRRLGISNIKVVKGSGQLYRDYGNSLVIITLHTISKQMVLERVIGGDKCGQIVVIRQPSTLNMCMFESASLEGLKFATIEHRKHGVFSFVISSSCARERASNALKEACSKHSKLGLTPAGEVPQGLMWGFAAPMTLVSRILKLLRVHESDSLAEVNLWLTQINPLHAGMNAWDSKGRHFVAVHGGKVYRSTDGGKTYDLLFAAPDNPDEVRLLFIDSRDNVFSSCRGQTSGTKGRLYRSINHGGSFDEVLGKPIWNMDEDADGTLYVGEYEHLPNVQGNAKVLKSLDGGETWIDISPTTTWDNLNHVHNVRVDPATGWLYCAIGDTRVCVSSGLWRSKRKDGSDWVRKLDNVKGNAQFIGIGFLNGSVYVSDDMKAGEVWRFTDDTTDNLQTNYAVVLKTGMVHNSYYLEKDLKGRMIVSFAPTNAGALLGGHPKGQVYISENGVTWAKILEVDNISYDRWFNSRKITLSEWTLRDGTRRFRTENDNLFTYVNGNSLRLYEG